MSGSIWRKILGGLGVLSLGLLSGCAVDRTQMDRALMREMGQAKRQSGVAEHYVVHCPDVLTLRVAGRPEWNGPHAVGTDGRIELNSLGRLRVEGKSLPDVQRLVAEVTHVHPEQVQARVADFNSQQIYLFGQVIGLQRAVAYRGQETVLDVLQRAGGITAGASTSDVYVIRPHIVDGKTPEVFHIDLQAIVQSQDEKTNIRLQPFDEIYVGETRQSCLEKCVPPWLRPLYEAACGLTRKLSFPDKPLEPRTAAQRLTLDTRRHTLTAPSR